VDVTSELEVEQKPYMFVNR